MSSLSSKIAASGILHTSAIMNLKATVQLMGILGMLLRVSDRFPGFCRSSPTVVTVKIYIQSWGPRFMNTVTLASSGSTCLILKNCAAVLLFARSSPAPTYWQYPIVWEIAPTTQEYVSRKDSAVIYEPADDKGYDIVNLSTVRGRPRAQY